MGKKEKICTLNAAAGSGAVSIGEEDEKRGMSLACGYGANIEKIEDLIAYRACLHPDLVIHIVSDFQKERI